MYKIDIIKYMSKSKIEKICFFLFEPGYDPGYDASILLIHKSITFNPGEKNYCHITFLL